MNPASSITNCYRDFRLLGLGRLTTHPEPGGPYLVVQDGADPGDVHMRQCSFVLTKRGSWLHYYLFLSIPKEVRTRLAIFTSAEEVVALAEQMPARVVVESLVSLRKWVEDEDLELWEQDPAADVLLKDLHGGLRGGSTELEKRQPA